MKKIHITIITVLLQRINNDGAGETINNFGTCIRRKQ